MNKLILFAIIIFSFTHSHAQTFEWLVTESLDYEANPSMVNYTTAVDHDENVFLFGTSEHLEFYSGSYGILFLKKYSAGGDPVWTREIDSLALATASINGQSGSVYIAGTYRSDLNFWDEGNLNYSGSGKRGFLARVSADGTLDWAVSLFDIYQNNSTPYDLAVDDSGHVYVAHTMWPDGYITKFDVDGNLVMDIMQESTGLISGIDVDNEGNIFATGSCSGNQGLFGGVIFPSPFTYSSYIVKYSPEGSPEWVNFIEDITCILPSLRLTESGSIYLSGPLTLAADFGSHQTAGPAWVFDFFITRLSPEGDFEWVVEVPQVMTGDASAGQLNHIAVNDQEHVIFGGFSRGSIDWGNGHQTISNLSNDIFLAEYDENGSMLWTKRAGGSYYDNVHSLVVSAENNIFMAGLAGDTVTFDTITHASEQIRYPVLAKIDVDLTTNIDEHHPSTIPITVYPNPAGELIHFSEKLQQVSIIDLSGKVLVEKIDPSGFNDLRIGQLTGGFYLVSGLNADQQMLKGKFVKY